MTGIAGIAREGREHSVETMLQKIGHRGRAGSHLISGKGATLGTVWSQHQERATKIAANLLAVWDAQHEMIPLPEALAVGPFPFALASVEGDGVFLARDLYGVRPLYYGYAEDGGLCFASEVKALLEVTREVKEFPAGHWYETSHGFQAFAGIEAGEVLTEPPEVIAADLRVALEKAVRRRIDGDVMGSWLSGGLDSSVIVALVRPYVQTLHTFAGGLDGAADLVFARKVAADLDCMHHEVLLTGKDLLEALPEVIYALESFDALLVRSTVVNYLVARRAADTVDEVFSGEGGDELFAGYAYLEAVSDEALSTELLEILGRLHNTALQRVDRSAGAHGLVPHLPFLDNDVARYVVRIPTALKRGPKENRIEKWILRKALDGRLEDSVLWRRKAKFWEGAGVGEILSRHAENWISDSDFSAERWLPNGWLLNTKEELMYYRIFKEHFGELDDLSWMGRTKGAPRQELAMGPDPQPGAAQ